MDGSSIVLPQGPGTGEVEVVGFAGKVVHQLARARINVRTTIPVGTEVMLRRCCSWLCMYWLCM
jgi:hypothetical protein